MAESLICTTELKKPGAGSSYGSLFQRRIEFHPARKPVSAFSNGGGDFNLETLNPSSDYSLRPAHNAGPSSAWAGKKSDGKKSDGGDVFEYGLDPELSFEITFRRIGAGLENLGNTCFLNSVLQCLTYTEPFAAYLQSGKHKSSCHTAGFCAMCAIQNHVRRALQSTGRILAPKDLVMNLRCISRNFRNARQEDAHEYMVNLLESMHKCCLPSGVPSESPSAFEKSLVHKIFGGRLRSQVKCMQCSYCSNKFDPFLDLSLEIVKADSLRKALTHFTAVEQLDGGERQYQCQCCKQKVRALKQLTVHKAPYVLSIHLKRFGSHIPGQKIDKKVEFGPTLDLKPFVSGSYEGDLKYTLYGVLVHAGWSTHSGHYYCFVRTSSGMWHSLDDNRVVQVSERAVLEQKAYMLFYVRDRRNLALKRPVDVVRKENVAANSIENKERSVSVLGLKKADQNGVIARGLSTSNCSSDVAETGAVDTGSLKGSLLKGASVLKTMGPLMAEGSDLLKDSMLGPSLKEPVKGPSVLHSTNGQFVAKGLPQSAPSLVKGSGTSSHPTIATGDSKINHANEHDGSKKDSNPVATPHNCSESQHSGSDKLATGRATHEIAVSMNEMVLSEALCKRVSDLETENIGSIWLSDQSGTEKGQDGGIANERGSCDQLCQKAVENCPRSKEIGSVKISSQSSMMNGCVQQEALDNRHYQKVPKPKKKLTKFRVASMHLGSNLLFRASLSLQKKRKHKRSKQRSLGLRSFAQEELLEEDSISRGLGPSTSEKTRMVALDSTHSRRQLRKSGANKTNGCGAAKDVRDANGDSTMKFVEEDFRERSGQNSAVLATNEPTQKISSSTSVANQCDTREVDDSQDKKKSSVQTCLMNMLTRGLGETIVERWDGIELPPPQDLGLSTAQSISIGYLPDEWGEYYDQGKRKKVRTSKNSFGGPNPFQEIATMKEQWKKAKTDQTSSGNRPIRI